MSKEMVDRISRMAQNDNTFHAMRRIIHDLREENERLQAVVEAAENLRSSFEANKPYSIRDETMLAMLGVEYLCKSLSAHDAAKGGGNE